MFYVASIDLTVLLVGVTLAVRLMAKPELVIVSLAILANGFFCVGVLLWPVIIATGLLVLCLLRWPPSPGDRRDFHIASVASVVGDFLLVAPVVVPNQVEYARLRARYPFEDLTARLPPRPPGTPPAFVPPTLEEQEYENDVRDRDGNWLSGRNLMLRTLHDHQTELFVNSPGFGVARIIRGNPSEKLLGEPRPLEQSPEPPLHQMVREDVRDFTDPLRFGYRRGNLVAGFLPHSLRRPPGPAMGWGVDKVQLVGLLLAPDPRVYVSESLPRMTELAGAVTRHLDGFESPALARLRAGEELVLDATECRLLGAIRSAKQCLACHGGDRGDLLGAFSYRLRKR